MRQIKPDPKVTELLGQIILDHKSEWKNVPNAGWTLEQVKSVPVPEREVYKGPCAAVVMDSPETTERLKEVQSLLKANLLTNSLVYPPQSFMKWHTNGDTVGTRNYYTFTTKSGRFIYRHAETGQLIVDEDQVGWTVREFEIDHDKPFWHCVWSDGIRFSFGFNKD